MSKRKPKKTNGKQNTKGKGRGRSRDDDRSDSTINNRQAVATYPGKDDHRYDNDPDWYLKTGQLTNDVMSFNFMYPIGAPNERIEYIAGESVPFTAAGIMRIDYCPCFGDIRTTTHPMNVAARLLYDTINAKNSRNPSYDPADVMMYIIAVAQAWSLHNWTKRVYGLFNNFSTLNRYWPDAILTSMGVDTDYKYEDMVKWRSLCNRMALKLNVLCVPDGIDYFKRAIFMCSGFYKDEDVSKPSLYYYNPISIMKLDYDDNDMRCLNSIPTPWRGYSDTAKIRPSDIETLFNSITDELFNDKDITTISTDILKAFGEGGLFRIPEVTENEFAYYQFQPFVAVQINNARFLGSKTLADNYQLRQKVTPGFNGLFADANLYDMGTTVPAARWIGFNNAHLDILVNLPIDNPNAATIAECSRLMFHIESSQAQWRLECGTEVAIHATIYKFESDADGNWTLAQYTNSELTPLTSNGGMSATSVHNWALMNKFNNHPILYGYQATTTGTQSNYAVLSEVRVLSDLQNYSTFNRQELKNINEACLLSLFMPVIKNVKTPRTK